MISLIFLRRVGSSTYAGFFMILIFYDSTHKMLIVPVENCRLKNYLYEKTTHYQCCLTPPVRLRRE